MSGKLVQGCLDLEVGYYSKDHELSMVMHA